MSFLQSRFFFWAALAFPPSLYATYECRRLKRSYPYRAAHPSSLLHIANSLADYVPDGDAKVFHARIPHSALIGSEIFTQQSLNDLWARAFTSNPKFLREGRLLGLIRYSKWSPGDIGEQGYFKGQVILNLFVVRRPPTDYDPLLYEWHMRAGAPDTSDWLASYGFPWRVMIGGRQELQALVEEGAGDMVEVSFGCAQDYRRVNSVTGKEDGRVLPRAAEWFHEMYARYLLDSAVQMLLKRERDRENGGASGGGWKATIPDVAAILPLVAPTVRGSREE